MSLFWSCVWDLSSEEDFPPHFLCCLRCPGGLLRPVTPPQTWSKCLSAELQFLEFRCCWKVVIFVERGVESVKRRWAYIPLWQGVIDFPIAVVWVTAMISNCFVFSRAVSRTSSSDLAAVKHHFTTLHFTCTSCDLITIFQWNRSIPYIKLLPQNQNVYNLSESYFFWISPKYFPEEDPAANQRRHTANVQAAFTMKSPRQWQSFVPRQWRSVPILHQLLARPFQPPQIFGFSQIFLILT